MRKNYNSDDFKLHIANIALDLFREKGYNNVSIDLICKEAEISKSGFYYHFKEKSDTFSFYYSRTNSNVDELIQHLLLDANPAEKLWLIMKQYLQQTVDDGAEFVKSVLSINLYDNKKVFSYKDAHSRTIYLNLLAKARSEGLIHSEIEDNDELIDLYLTTTLGITYKWCLTNSDFDYFEECKKAFEVVFGYKLK